MPACATTSRMANQNFPCPLFVGQRTAGDFNTDGRVDLPVLGDGDASYQTTELESLIAAVDFVSLDTYPFHDTHFESTFRVAPFSASEMSVQKAAAAIPLHTSTAAVPSNARRERVLVNVVFSTRRLFAAHQLNSSVYSK